jgi:UDP-glucuronate 4-epimerase
MAGDAIGSPVNIDRQPVQPGDVQRTGGCVDRAHAVLGWAPKVDVASGLARQAEWHRSREPARA